MRIKPHYSIVYDSKNVLIIKDEHGPISITNGIERILEELPLHGGKRLFYVDSENRIDEIVLNHSGTEVLHFNIL